MIPYVILGSGQSNAELVQAYSWTPCENAQLWNWPAEGDGQVGTAFTPLDPTHINVFWRYASEVARLNPGRAVYLINISFGGMAISHWLPGTVSPNVFQNVVANAVSALATIGVQQIDEFLWWQGEADSDGGSLFAAYPANFSALMMRLQSEPWFPRFTPVKIFQVGTSSVFPDRNEPARDQFAAMQNALVASESETRSLVNTAAFGPASAVGEFYWQTNTVGGNPGHPTALGADMIGAQAARTNNLGLPISGGSWVPTDASGAGLVFSNVRVGWSRVGSGVVVYGRLTYPTTQNTDDAFIGGLPIASASDLKSQNIQYAFSAALGGIAAIPIANSSTFQVNTMAGGNVTNNQLSGTAISFAFLYPAT